MSTDAESAGDDDSVPQLVDRERWSGDVEAAATGTIEWGTHSWRFRLQSFDDGTGNLHLNGPSDPLCAREIVADFLTGPGIEPWAAAVMADEWGIDIDEVDA